MINCHQPKIFESFNIKVKQDLSFLRLMTIKIKEVEKNHRLL